MSYTNHIYVCLPISTLNMIMLFKHIVLNSVTEGNIAKIHATVQCFVKDSVAIFQSTDNTKNKV